MNICTNDVNTINAIRARVKEALATIPEEALKNAMSPGFEFEDFKPYAAFDACCRDIALKFGVDLRGYRLYHIDTPDFCVAYKNASDPFDILVLLYWVFSGSNTQEFSIFTHGELDED